MTIPQQREGQGDGRMPTDLRLLAAPLDFIAGDHRRERRICALIDSIATDADHDPALMADVAAFLETELLAHMTDEVEDLFPLMRRRCAPEDRIGPVLTELKSDHVRTGKHAPRIREILARCLSQERAPDAGERAALAVFAAQSRRRMIAETAIVLPIARVRLTPADLSTLRLRMAARRGVTDTMEG